MTLKKQILQELATWVTETVDVAGIIDQHNRRLPQEDPSYVVPIDNKDASQKVTGQPYGVKVVINQSNKRDDIMSKIWQKMSTKSMMRMVIEGKQAREILPIPVMLIFFLQKH